MFELISLGRSLAAPGCVYVGCASRVGVALGRTSYPPLDRRPHSRIVEECFGLTGVDDHQPIQGFHEPQIVMDEGIGKDGGVVENEPRPVGRLPFHRPPHGHDVGAGRQSGRGEQQAEEAAADIGMAGEEHDDCVLRPAPNSSSQLLELPLDFLFSDILVDQNDRCHRLVRPETRSAVRNAATACASFSAYCRACV